MLFIPFLQKAGLMSTGLCPFDKMVENLSLIYLSLGSIDAFSRQRRWIGLCGSEANEPST